MFYATKESMSYLDTACMGLVSKEVLNEIRKFLFNLENISSSPTKVTVDMYQYLPRARESVAKLLNVSSEEIAIVESTSHGLGLIANSLPLKKEDNILVCDLEFMSSTLCWKVRQEQVGFEIRKVKTKNGEIKISDFEEVIDKNTKAIVIASVQEINGFRANIKEFTRLARANGCYLVVDGIQEAGVLDVNLSELDVDFYCAGGHKWLRNPFGSGFLYINKKIMHEIEPSFYGYFNVEEPKYGWQNYLESPLRTPFDKIEINRTAQKFETGSTGNYIGALSLHKNIELILDKDIRKIEQKVLELNSKLIQGLDDLNLSISSSIEMRYRSGITSFNLPGGLDEERKLCEELTQNRIFVSLRYTSGVGGIRVSPYYYNSTHDIERLLEITRTFLKNKGR